MKLEKACLVLLVLATILFAPGCASTSGGGATQLKQTRERVDWAMVRYHNRAAFGFLTYEERQQVETAYKAYQTAFNEAFQQAHSNLNTPTPDNVKQLADRLLSILDTLP